MRAEWSPMRECWASGSNFMPWPLHWTQHIRSSPLTTGDNEGKPWSKYPYTSSRLQPTTKLILLQQSNTSRELGMTHKLLRILPHPLCRSRKHSSSKTPLKKEVQCTKWTCNLDGTNGDWMGVEWSPMHEGPTLAMAISLTRSTSDSQHQQHQWTSSRL